MKAPTSCEASRDVAHLVLSDDFPAARRGGVGGGPLEHHVGGTVQQGAVRQVRVPCHPAAVSSAPVGAKEAARSEWEHAAMERGSG